MKPHICKRNNAWLVYRTRKATSFADLVYLCATQDEAFRRAEFVYWTLLRHA
jgi:hypothetical protein